MSFSHRCFRWHRSLSSRCSWLGLRWPAAKAMPLSYVTAVIVASVFLAVEFQPGCSGNGQWFGRHVHAAVHHLRRDSAAQHAQRKWRSVGHSSWLHRHHAGSTSPGDHRGLVVRIVHRRLGRIRNTRRRLRAAVGRAWLSGQVGGDFRNVDPVAPRFRLVRSARRSWSV